MEDGAARSRVRCALRSADGTGGSRRLAFLIARYGKAIEFDLLGLGLDLVTEWRSRRWRRLLNIIDQLPRNSRYAEAQAQDDELAEAYLRTNPIQAAPQPPRLSEYDAGVERLDLIADRLAVAVAILGRAKKSPPQQLRPIAGIDRARSRTRSARHKRLVSQLLPNRTE